VTSQPDEWTPREYPGAPGAAYQESDRIELLDQVHTEGLPYRAVVADAGYGLSVDFRRGLTNAGGLHRCIAGNEAVLTELPHGASKLRLRGAAATKTLVSAGDAAPPVAVKRLAETLERTRSVGGRAASDHSRPSLPGCASGRRTAGHGPRG